MKLNELLDNLDQLIREEHLDHKEHVEQEKPKKKKPSFGSRVSGVIVKFVRAVVSAPFVLIGSFIRNELMHALKKDLKKLTVFAALGLLLVFVTGVLWFSVSVYLFFHYIEREGLTPLYAVEKLLIWQAGGIAILVVVMVWIKRSFKTKGLMQRLGQTKY